MSHVLERSGGRLGFFRRWMHGSRELADDFIGRGIEDWATEGHISDEEMALLAVESHATCPQWNYTIRPRQIGK